MFRISDVALESFYATVKVSVNTASNNDFAAAIIYGDQSGDTRKTGYVRADIRQMSNRSCKGLFGLFDCRTNLLASVSVAGILTKGKSDTGMNEHLPYSESNPTPGMLAFLKKGHQCRVFWNGKEMGSWEEHVISNGYLWIAFVPMKTGEASATFEDISIYRLHEAAN
jgi:hypothetical protein